MQLVAFSTNNSLQTSIKNRLTFSIKRDHWLHHYLDTHSCATDKDCLKSGCQKVLFSDIFDFIHVNQMEDFS